MAAPTRESGPLGRIDPKHPAAAAPAPPPPQRVAAASTVVIAGFLALVAILVLFGAIAEDIRDQEVLALDTWATPFLHSIASPPLDALMLTFTTMGSIVVLVPVFIVVAIALLVSRHYGAALFFGIASGGGLVLRSSTTRRSCPTTASRAATR